MGKMWYLPFCPHFLRDTDPHDDKQLRTHLCAFEVLSFRGEGWRFGFMAKTSICSFQYEWACKFGGAGAAEMWNWGWHAERPRHAGLIQTAFDVCLCVKWAGGPEFTKKKKNTRQHARTHGCARTYACFRSLHPKPRETISVATWIQRHRKHRIL